MSVAKMKASAPTAVHAELDGIDSAITAQCADASQMASVWDILNQLRVKYSVPWGKFVQFAMQEVPVILALVVAGTPLPAIMSKVGLDLLAFLFPPVPITAIPA